MVPGAPPLVLRCPVDARHAAFKGVQHACHEAAIDLDPAGTVLGCVVGPRLYDVSEPRDHEIACAICGARVWAPRRSIAFIPSAGMIVLCDFSSGFRPPEMVKMRPVVIVSAYARNRQTCSVVPLSTVAPSERTSVAVPIDAARYPFLSASTWAKCDMVTTIARRRLFLLRDRANGRGIDSRKTTLDAVDLTAVRAGIGLALSARY
jgi:uncharacterized protein YifN (PemK superfamily)